MYNLRRYKKEILPWDEVKNMQISVENVHKWTYACSGTVACWRVLWRTICSAHTLCSSGNGSSLIERNWQKHIYLDWHWVATICNKPTGLNNLLDKHKALLKDTNLANYWKENHRKHPSLAKFAKGVLGVLSLYSTMERQFSEGVYRLSNDRFKRLMFVTCNNVP